MIFVTGATGTVGSELVKILKAQKHAVTAASRDPASARAALGVPTVAWHWDQPRHFAKALKGVKTLFLATPPGMSEEKDWGLAAVFAAGKCGVRKIVKLSASGVEHMPDSPHRIVERAIEAGAFKWVFLRPSFFMQNFSEGMAPGIKSGSRISVPAGAGRIGFIDARDIAAVAAAAINGDGLDGQGLTLTGSEALGFLEIADQLGKAIGRPLRYDDLSAADFTALSLKSGMSRHYAEFMTTLYNQVVRNGFAAGITENVKKITGRDPVRFQHFAKDFAMAFAA